MNRTFSGIMLTLLLIGMLTLAFNLQPVKASGTIYIRADGSIDPPTAPISTVDNITYTFTGNIYDEIVIQRSSITIDGNGYTLQGSGTGNGFYLSGTNNVTIQNVNVKNFSYGIKLYSSSNNAISGNTMTNNDPDSIKLDESSNNNTISGNNMTSSHIGVAIWSSSFNTVYGNNIIGYGGGNGIYLLNSSSNTISGNNIANTYQGLDFFSSSNNNTISGNNIINCSYYGIVLDNCFSNTLSGNNITNSRGGVWFSLSSNSVLRNNIMAGNRYNFRVSGFYEHSIHDVDESNTVDGKPIYYLINCHDMEIPSNAGYVSLINSNNITVKGLELKNNGDGVRLFYTNNSQIANNTIIDNYVAGVYLSSCSRNTVSGNIMTKNLMGVWLLKSSSNNTISENNVINNSLCGVILDSSSNNTVSGNNIANNYIGLGLESSSFNTIHGNNIINNIDGLGSYSSSSNNRIYHNNFINNTRQVNPYDPNCVNVWDDGYPSGGNYWSDYTGVDLYSGHYQNETGSDGIGDTTYVIDANNTDSYPLMNPLPIPDIAIINIKLSKTIVGQGYSMFINVTVKNQGYYPETFNVKLCANTTIIDTLANIMLASGNSTIITFTWNTTGWTRGNYTISAVADFVQGEVDIADNTLFADMEVCVTIPGDVDGDFDVDLFDAVKLLKCYGAWKDNPSYDPNCDIDGDGDIDLFDAVILLMHYGQKDP